MKIRKGTVRSEQSECRDIMQRPGKFLRPFLVVPAFLLLTASCARDPGTETGGTISDTHSEEEQDKDLFSFLKPGDPDQEILSGKGNNKDGKKNDEDRDDQGKGKNPKDPETPAFSSEGAAPGDTIRLLGAEDATEIHWYLRDTEENRILEDSDGSHSILIRQEYNEHFLDCRFRGKGGKEQVISIYISELPVIYLESDTDYKDTNKTFREIRVKLVGNDRYGDGVDYEGGAKLKVRGNSTSERDKKPFALKLDSKEQLLGMGDKENKHWVLLANDIDHTHMRNEIVQTVGEGLGSDPTCDLAHVVLIYNGEYEGLYQLGEQVRVDPGRMEIYDWEKTRENAANKIAIREWKNAGYDSAKDMEEALIKEMSRDFSWIDEKKVNVKWTDYDFADYGIEIPDPEGGYLLEMDFYALLVPNVASLTTEYGQPLYFNTPEPGNGKSSDLLSVADFKKCALYEDAEEYIQTLEYAFHSPDFTFHSGEHTVVDSPFFFDWNNNYDPATGWVSDTGTIEYSDPDHEGMHYSELADMDSFVSYFLATEYSMNWDSMKNSFFVYRDLATAEDSRLKAGPLWDYDFAFGNINMFNIDTYYPEEWQTTSEYYTKEQVYQSYNWFRLLIKDPYFLVRTYEAYHRNEQVFENVIAEGGLLDREQEYLRDAALANDKRWEYTYDTDYSGAVSEHFDDANESLREFIETRDAWMKEQFSDLDTYVTSLGYYKSANELKLEAEHLPGSDSVRVTAKLTGQNADKVCTQIRFRLNGTYTVTVPLKNNRAQVDLSKDILVSEEEAANGVSNVVVAEELDSNGEPILLTEWKPSGNFEPLIRSDYIRFTSE